jgi:hypothetical protein
LLPEKSGEQKGTLSMHSQWPASPGQSTGGFVRRRVWRGSRAIGVGLARHRIWHLHCRDFSTTPIAMRISNRVLVMTAYSSKRAFPLSDRPACRNSPSANQPQTRKSSSRACNIGDRPNNGIVEAPLEAIVPSIAKPWCGDGSRTSNSRAGGRVRAEGHPPSLGAYNVPAGCSLNRLRR